MTYTLNLIIYNFNTHNEIKVGYLSDLTILVYLSGQWSYLFIAICIYQLWYKTIKD